MCAQPGPPPHPPPKKKQNAMTEGKADVLRNDHKLSF